MKLDWFTVNHYYAGTENIPPSFQTFDVVKREDAEALEKRNAELESVLCDTCKDPACEDSRLAYYVAKAIKAGERIGRLEMALADIAEGDCTCFEDDSCAACRAKKELRGGE